MTRKTPPDAELDELVGALREAGDMMRRQHGTKARLSYDEAADAIWCLRRDLRVLADALEQTVKERDDLMLTLTELAPADPVLVEGSWFDRAVLPDVLGRFMRSSAEYAREAKEAVIRLDGYAQALRAERAERAKAEAERDALADRIERAQEPLRDVRLSDSARVRRIARILSEGESS